MEKMIREPENSWEISYVIGLKEPEMVSKNVRLMLACREAESCLRPGRMGELQKWASENYDRKWFKDHYVLAR